MIYKTSPTKRTKLEIEHLRDAIYRIAAEYAMTVRHLFYRMVGEGLIEKSEREYKNVTCRLSAEMRRDGLLPYEWIIDETRWVTKPRTFSGVESMLQRTRETYRRALWDNQPRHCEVWSEKRAIGAILSEVTHEWDIPLYTAGGFSSMTFLYGAGKQIAEIGKPTEIFYFGDYDPSGLKIAETVERDIRHHAGDGVDINFHKLAVEPWQIYEWGLPTRPTKREGNTHAKDFEGDSVEIDTIRPETLKRILRTTVESFVNTTHLAVTQAAEASERESLSVFIDRFKAAGGLYVN
jgi:hypothetical protein